MKRLLVALSVVIAALPACSTKRWARTTDVERGMVAAAYRKLPGSYSSRTLQTGVSLDLRPDGTYEATGWGCHPSPWGLETGEWHPDEKGFELNAKWRKKPEPFVARAYTVVASKKGTALLPRLPYTVGKNRDWGWREKPLWKNKE